ncbi:MAG: methylated-DNA--[protein]-cysteine S-methyltransferase [Solirubrobacteraceae bacterium]
MRIATHGNDLVGLALDEGWSRVERHLRRWFREEQIRAADAPREAVRRLDAYLTGDLDALNGIAVDPRGTGFQRSVWTAVQDVPAGQVLSYTDLARGAGAANATRAVGTACGANPIWLVIPCHRIVRADGSLGDYGDNPERKQWLLAHERLYRETGPAPLREHAAERARNRAIKQLERLGHKVILEPLPQVA